jgi:hypothetical protein
MRNLLATIGDRSLLLQSKEYRGAFQPTTLPTEIDALHDFRVFRHFPRSCKSL